MLIAINISNLFLAFKYVKHYHLGQTYKYFTVNLRIKIMVNKPYEKNDNTNHHSRTKYFA